MELPVLNGVIERRILVNYRVNPDRIKALLPSHLEPLVINGYASAGICLLRLTKIGIRYSPSMLRITSENAAHRFLVKYSEGGKELTGVYIPRRDTDSKLNVFLAGKIFSWPHYAATFDIEEGDGRYSVKMESRDMNTRLAVKTFLTERFPTDSMFDSLDHASACFRDCPVGISPSKVLNQFKRMRLATKSWEVRPLELQELRSSFYEDTNLFPLGTITFDNALLMEGIAHEWRSV